MNRSISARHLSGDPSWNRYLSESASPLSPWVRAHSPSALCRGVWPRPRTCVRTYEPASMDKNDSAAILLSRGTLDDGSNASRDDASARGGPSQRLPGHGVSGDDQRQIQNSDSLGPQGGTAPLQRNPGRPAARRGRDCGNRAAGAQPRTQGAGRRRTDCTQGLWPRSAQGRISPHRSGREFHPDHRLDPRMGRAPSGRRDSPPAARLGHHVVGSVCPGLARSRGSVISRRHDRRVVQSRRRPEHRRRRLRAVNNNNRGLAGWKETE